MEKDFSSVCAVDAYGPQQKVDERKTWLLLFTGNTLSFLGLQVFVWWLGSLFPSVEYLGFILSIGILMLFVLLNLIFIKIADKIFAQLTCLFALGGIGLYLSTTIFFSWWLIGISSLLIALGIFLGEKNKISHYTSYGYGGAYMLYACCAWLAMSSMNFAPAAPVYYWGILLLITLMVWIIPIFSK